MNSDEQFVIPDIHALNWVTLHQHLDAQGWAVIPRLLDPATCSATASMYNHREGFRSTVVMSRHNFGRGEYRYFAYPLPALVEQLRTTLYSHLAPIANSWANSWHEALHSEARFPADHASFIARCHAAGQAHPTPLLLRYGVNDYNCLHQDLYGEQVFPLQVAVLLDKPGRDFSGGEFVLTEQRPRMQSRVTVVPLDHGDAVVFAVRHRPVQGARGAYRVTMRHGVSAIRSGHRHTLGIIFHDAA